MSLHEKLEAWEQALERRVVEQYDDDLVPFFVLVDSDGEDHEVIPEVWGPDHRAQVVEVVRSLARKLDSIFAVLVMRMENDCVLMFFDTAIRSKVVGFKVDRSQQTPKLVHRYEQHGSSFFQGLVAKVD